MSILLLLKLFIIPCACPLLSLRGDCSAVKMGQKGEAKVSCHNILTYHRELLVSRLRSIQCILDNLSAGGFVCEEDVEIVQRTITKTDQVGKPK